MGRPPGLKPRAYEWQAFKPPVRVDWNIPLRGIFMATASADPAVPTESTIDLDVTGMTCAACQANVQRALARQPGVRDASVNLVTAKAHVAIDPSVVTTDQLMHAVEDVGYGASVTNREASAGGGRARQGPRPDE